MADPQRASLAGISGPDSMSKPDAGPSGSQPPPQQSISDIAKPKRRKTHRGGKNRRKTRRPSFAASASENGAGMDERPSLLDAPDPRSSAHQHSFYRLQSGSNRSNTSLESEALLDHREHGAGGRSRRESLHNGFARPSLPNVARQQRGSAYAAQRGSGNRPSVSRGAAVAISEDDEEDDQVGPTDRTPLLSSSARNRSKPELSRHNSGAHHGSHATQRHRRLSGTSRSSIKTGRIDVQSRTRPGEAYESEDEYDVNNPPSVPNSPKLGSLEDGGIDRHSTDRGRDAVINIDSDYVGGSGRKPSESSDGINRRSTVADLAERDVCFPGDGDMSDIGEDGEEGDRHSQQGSTKLKRRRTRQWPQYDVLEQWALEEKEERTHQEQIRVKRISEPVMVGGRLRPGKTVWHREESDAPFRFTYFNELIETTIHARTISDLLQDGYTFQDLFTPEPVVLSDSSDGEGDEESKEVPRHSLHQTLQGKLDDAHFHTGPFEPEELSQKPSPSESKTNTRSNTPAAQDENDTPRDGGGSTPRASKRYGARPTFWLDVLSPTEAEMTVLARTFGIHQLTTEDILMEEQREKVELFNKYYFVNYRSFEQDSENENHLEPVNIYIIVFREGVISFHHSMTPHPANVRRRIRQLNDYMSPSADWISYAIIDDVTDVYLPLVQQIETEVDDIDDCILGLRESTVEERKQPQKVTGSRDKNPPPGSEKERPAGEKGGPRAEGEKSGGESGGEMLRRVGECRKKVMSMYRLLGNKADVIKGFAKRCNEHWHVAPRSEIGLYLGDIQDHIVTMTGNLSHYENLLSRAHSNYLAQINIRMNERAEQTADVLGKLTVLGTIVLPMNIVTGMWGMNVWVPGQDIDHDLTWFWCITAGLVAFGCTCFLVAKRVYGIV
ncbi:CorA metal ion transporter [Teratosphaeriaceae sp. CCFEE 6253]|nr:CorA metal ion transporter [Teratosphaeriaceae sp. CCFEE 6253]